MEKQILAEMGMRLYKARIAAGLSQDDLADKVFCDRTKISRVECGKDSRVTIHFLFQCARALKNTYLEWEIISLLGGMLAIPALDQSRIDGSPMSVIGVILTECREALPILEEAQRILRNKNRPDQVTQAQRDFLDLLTLQVLELVPAAYQLAVTIETHYGYEPGRGRDLLERRLLERGYIAERKTPAATGVC